jgi:hypothetical protein
LGLYVASLNEVIDLHEDRVTVGLHYHLPPILLWALVLVAFLSMGMLGIHFGLSGTRNLPATVALWLRTPRPFVTLRGGATLAPLDRPTLRRAPGGVGDEEGRAGRGSSARPIFGHRPDVTACL